jgi:hypothetical protein
MRTFFNFYFRTSNELLGRPVFLSELFGFKMRTDLENEIASFSIGGSEICG